MLLPIASVLVLVVLTVLILAMFQGSSRSDDQARKMFQERRDGERT